METGEIAESETVSSRMLQMDAEDEEEAESAVYWWQMVLQAMVIMDADTSRGGSVPGKAGNILRSHQAMHVRYMQKYFWPCDSVNPISGLTGPSHPEATFERRFRMPRIVFKKLFNGVLANSAYFRQGLNADCCGRMGITPLVKIIVALRQVSYGLCTDVMDEVAEVSQTTARLCLLEFCKCVDEVFSMEFLRVPTSQDIERIELQFRKLGFPGCIGAVDCVGWEWKNCPVALQGSLKGKGARPELRAEAICDMDLWIWHWQFGFPGVYNDLQILDNSVHFSNVLSGNFPPSTVSYEVCGQAFNFFYYLADGIYPNWKVFLKTLSSSCSAKEKYYKKCQEAVRKVVERVFGVLFRRFQVLYSPSELMDVETMKSISKACVIMNNMIVELRRDSYTSDGGGGLSINFDADSNNDTELELHSLPSDDHESRLQLIAPVIESIRDRSELKRLTCAVVDYLWERKGSEGAYDE